MLRTHLFTPRTVLRSAGSILLAVSTAALMWLPVAAPGLLAVFVAGAVLLGGSFAVDHAIATLRRRQSLELAARIGWHYAPQLPGLFARLETPPFDATELNYRDVIYGNFRGIECYDGILDWRIKLGDDATMHGTHRVAAVRLADELPRVMVLPEDITSRLGRIFGARDHHFESAAFNAQWRVLADDDKVAHEMLSPRVIARLEDLTLRAPMIFEKGIGVRLDSDTIKVGTLADRLSGLIAVARFLPTHTVEDYGRFANSIGPLPSVTTPGALTGGYDPELARHDAEFERAARQRKFERWRRTPRRPGEAPAPMYGADE